MKTCVHCGALNNNSDTYCDWCGSMLPAVKAEPVQDGREHDFTTGVMRYAPDTPDPEGKEFPVYLTRQAAGALLQTREDAQGKEPSGAVPNPPQSGKIQPVPNAVPKAADNKAKKNRWAVAILLTTIGVLLGLILIGILVLLRG